MVMSVDDITLLKYIASTENISVEYYDGGKSYAIPVAAFLLDDKPHSFDDLDETTMVCVDCSYILQLGIPMILCEITYGEAEVLLEKIFIPLDTKRRTKHQRDIMSLVNLCSKRVIAQEMSRSKYALASAMSSMSRNKQYN